MPKTKVTWRSLLTKLATFIYGDHILGLPFTVSLTLVTTYMHFVGSPDVTRNDLGLRIIAVMVSQVVVLLGINLSYRICRFALSGNIAPFAFLATLPFIGAVRGYTVQYALFEFGIMKHEDYSYRIISSAIILPIAVAFLGYTIGITREWSSKSQELRVSHAKLTALLSDAAVKSESELSADLDFIKSELLRGLQSNSVSKKGELLGALESLVTEVLKPMSAQLVSASPLPNLSEKDLNAAKFSVASLLRFITLKNSSRPIAVSVFLIVTFLPVTVRFQGVLASGLAVAITLLLITPFLYLLRNLVAKVVDPLPATFRLPLIVLLLATADLPFALLMPAFLPQGQAAHVLPIQALVTIEILGLFMGIGAAIEQEVRRVQRDLYNNLEKIQWRTAHIYSTHWFNKRQYARKLHGPVQAEILASIVRLERDPRESQGGAFAKHAIATKLLGILNTPRLELKPLPILHEIVETWDGICSVTLDVNTGVEEALISDQVACESALEIIREACSNAIQHGKASQISVSMRLLDSQNLAITVQDNGTGSSIQDGEGLGSRHLVECTITHSLTRAEPGVRLFAVLPVVVSQP